MTNYYIEKDGKIIFVDTDLQRLQNTVALGEYSELEIKETERPIVNFEFADTPEYIAEQKQKENAIIKQDILKQLDQLDAKSIRALREGNTERIAQYEAQAQKLREQLNATM